MEFFGIGPGELLLILVIALIVFGPRRLPEIGRTLGKTIRDFRQASQDLTVQLRGEIDSASEELTAASDELSGHQSRSAPQSATTTPGEVAALPAGGELVTDAPRGEQPPVEE